MISTISLRAGIGRVLSALSLLAMTAVVHAEPAEFFDLAPVSSSNAAGGTLPSQVSGKLSFSEEDLRVKVMGGYVRITRDFDGSQWYINSRWTSLAFTAGAGLVSDIAAADAAAETSTTFGGTKVPGTVNLITGDYPGVLTTINRNGALFYADATGYTFVQPGNRRYTIRPLGLNAAAAVGGIAVTLSGGQPVLPATITGWRWQNNVSGEWIEYDRDGRIKRYGDRNNVQVSFQYTGERITAIQDHFGNVVLSIHYDANGRIDQVQDVPRIGDTSPARVVTYAYNAAGSLTTITDVLGNNTLYGYDTKKRLTSRTDAEAHTRTFGWAANNRINKVTEADGAVTDYAYTYDKTARQYQVTVQYPDTVAGRRIVKSSYDADGRLVRREINGRLDYTLAKDGRSRTVNDAAGNATQTTEDEYGNITKTVYADGATTSATYSPLHGQVLEETDELGVKTQYEYDVKGNLTKQIEAVGYPEQRTTLWTYDSNGNVLTRTIKGIAGLPGASAEDQTITYTYDDYGNRSTVIDALTHTTTYTYNRLGQHVTITDARGKLWQSAYDKAGRLTSRTNPLSQTESYQYDKLGNRARTTDLNGTVWVRTYDVRSRPRTTGVLNAPVDTTYTYDAAGRLIKHEQAGAQASVLAYDIEGRMLSTTDRHGNKAIYQYDAAGRITQEELRDPANTLLRKSTRSWDSRSRLTAVTALPHLQQTYGYDTKGRQTTQTNGLGHVQHTDYDALDRVVEVRDPLDAETQLAYDSRDGLIRVTDPRGLQTAYQTDLGDCLTTLASPDTGNATSSCNELSQRITATDARGVAQTLTRDDLGRVTGISYAGAPSEAVTYGYDDTASGNLGVGRLTSANNAAASIARRYDARGFLVEDSRTLGGQTYTTSYENDNAGQLLGMVYPSGRRVIYQRNEVGEITAVLTQAASGGTETVLSNLVWTADGQLQSLDYGNGLAEARTYGQDGYLSQIAITGEAGSLLTRTYTRDTAGRITGITDGSAPRSETYGYDHADRLTSASGPYGTRAYTYDDVGNRLTQTEDSADSSYTYGSTSNRLTQITGADAASLDYDAAGNTTTKGNLVFSYNAAGRLSGITLPGPSTLTFAYNALGERVSKANPTTTTHFHYDLRGHLIAETTTSGDVIREYLWLGDIPVGLIATRTSGTEPELFAVHTDHLATTLAITDGIQQTVWQATREPFGQITTIASAVQWPLRFPGQYEDGETGIFYNYFRDYDAEFGRYIQSDPIGLDGGVNTYAYVSGNPSRYTDQYGLCIDLCIVETYTLATVIVTLAGAAGMLKSAPTREFPKTIKPKGISGIEERVFNDYCKFNDDPCAALKALFASEYAGAWDKINAMLNDRTMFGTKKWDNHATNLRGRIDRLAAIISLGIKLGCDMSAEMVLMTALYVPNSPRGR